MIQTEQTEKIEAALENLDEHAEACEKKGIYPYEGKWLTVNEIKDQITRTEFSDRIKVFEVGLLFAMVYVISGLSLFLISNLIY